MKYYMKSRPLISIIIPVYNAESTISRVLDSLTNNSFNLEIICVNDGSKDESENTINQYIEKDNRIRQIIRDNGGASEARNTGIKNCLGKYIMFCDADDEYSNDLLRYVIEDIDEFEPDYIVFNRRTVYEDGSGFDWLKRNERNVEDSFNWIEYFNCIMMDRNHSNVVFNKVYKASIVYEYKIEFTNELLLCEDLYFNFLYLQHVNNMIEDGRAIYLQHKVANSFTASKRKDYYNQDIKVIDIIYRNHRDKIGQIDSFINKHILKSAIHAIERAMLGRDAEIWKESRDIIFAILDDVMFNDAYDKFANDTDLYTRNKLLLLHKRFIFLYYLRYIFMPKVKESIFRHG